MSIMTTISAYKNAFIVIMFLIMAGALYVLYNKTVSLHDKNKELSSKIDTAVDENKKLIEYNKISQDLREQQLAKVSELETTQRNISDKLRKYDAAINTQQLIISALNNRLTAQETLNMEAQLYIKEINAHTATMEKK